MTRNDAIVISAKVKVDKNMYGNKIPPVEKMQDFAVLNLPPKKYKNGDKISAMIVPTCSKSYYICISQSSFDEAIKDIILPVFDYHFE